MTQRDERSAPGRARLTKGDRAGLVALWLEVLAGLIIVLLVVVEILQGGAPDPTMAWMSVVTYLALVLFVFFVARTLARGRTGARLPAMVWNFFLLPVSVSFFQSGRFLLGLLTLALALTVLVGCGTGLVAENRPGSGDRRA